MNFKDSTFDLDISSFQLTHTENNPEVGVDEKSIALLRELRM